MYHFVLLSYVIIMLGDCCWATLGSQEVASGPGSPYATGSRPGRHGASLLLLWVDRATCWYLSCGPEARTAWGFAASAASAPTAYRLHCLQGPWIVVGAGTSYWASVGFSLSWTLTRERRIFLGFVFCCCFLVCAYWWFQIASPSCAQIRVRGK